MFENSVGNGDVVPGGREYLELGVDTGRVSLEDRYHGKRSSDALLASSPKRPSPHGLAFRVLTPTVAATAGAGASTASSLKPSHRRPCQYLLYTW